MKLRSSFSSHQLVFVLSLSLLLAAVATAQDKITTKDGRIQDVKILGVSGANVQAEMKMGAGTGMMGIPLANIAPNGISMAPPAPVIAAVAAYNAKDYAKAVGLLKPVVDKFKGLPVVWAQQATGLLGDVYVALNKLPEAEAAYNDFQKIYGGQGSAQTDVGLARVAFSKKDYAAAKAKLEPIRDRALAEKFPAAGMAQAYSQTFYLLGQINEAEQQYADALENYLRTVTLFFHDQTSASAAKVRADALRQEHTGITVP